MLSRGFKDHRIDIYVHTDARSGSAPDWIPKSSDIHEMSSSVPPFQSFFLVSCIIDIEYMRFENHFFNPYISYCIMYRFFETLDYPSPHHPLRHRRVDRWKFRLVTEGGRWNRWAFGT